MRDRSQLLRGTLEGCILKAINDEETYGYEIAEKLKCYGFDDLSEGTIYPLLIRLEKNGLLNSEKKESPYGPRRKYYTLSDKGKEELEEFYISWEMLKNNIDTLFKDYKNQGRTKNE